MLCFLCINLKQIWDCQDLDLKVFVILLRLIWKSIVRSLMFFNIMECKKLISGTIWKQIKTQTSRLGMWTLCIDLRDSFLDIIIIIVFTTTASWEHRSWTQWPIWGQGTPSSMLCSWYKITGDILLAKVAFFWMRPLSIKTFQRHLSCSSWMRTFWKPSVFSTAGRALVVITV